MYGVWRVRQPDLDDPAIIAGAAVLRRGGLVAFPTETVYGLGAHAFDPLAAVRVFHAKGRPLSDPLIVHLAHRGQLAAVAAEVPPLASTLAEAFWPGPLTLVLPRHPQLPREICAGLDSVAVRVPSHPVARALLRACGVPVAAPSANRFSRPSPTSAGHVVADLGDVVDAILDGGETHVGIESTIARVDGDRVTVLRPGAVSIEELARVAGEVVYRGLGIVAEGVAAQAPGQLLKHYAPDAALHLADGPREAALAWIRAARAAAEAEGRRVGLLLDALDAEALPAGASPLASLGAGSPVDAAHHLFGALRQLDALGVDLILGRMPPPDGLGLGLRDRLFRAARGQVFVVG